MESKKRLYIVSFGDSRKYRVEVDDHSTTYVHENHFLKLEKELNDYLAEKFPDSTFAYYTTPRVTEVDVCHAAKYDGYPELDGKAVEEIKKVLVEEIRNMESQRGLDNNAPFADVSVDKVAGDCF